MSMDEDLPAVGAPLERQVRPHWVPDPTIWRWPSYKLRGVEWRYALHKTRDNAEPLYSEDDLLECVADAVAAERERCAKVCEQQRVGIDGFGGIEYHIDLTRDQCAAAIRGA